MEDPKSEYTLGVSLHALLVGFLWPKKYDLCYMSHETWGQHIRL